MPGCKGISLQEHQVAGTSDHGSIHEQSLARKPLFRNQPIKRARLPKIYRAHEAEFGAKTLRVGGKGERTCGQASGADALVYTCVYMYMYGYIRIVRVGLTPLWR